ncbi:hypothetical protein U1Q18_010227 [Sarracenia purpurea var. burkii]
MTADVEASDEQVADDTTKVEEAEVEISDVMLRTAEHDIGMAVQKFKNMKDTLAAQIQARRGKFVQGEPSELPPTFRSTHGSRAYQSIRGRG